MDLLETSNPSTAEEFWHQPENLALVEETMEECPDQDVFLDQVPHLRESVTKEDFWTEQKDFDDYAHGWEVYSDICQNTHERKPVLWDLCCGEGGFSRGAQYSGFDCYGFDKKETCAHRYEHDPSIDGSPLIIGM